MQFLEDDLLEYSRLSRVELRKREVNLNELVRHIALSVEEEQANITINSDLPTLMGSEVQLAKPILLVEDSDDDYESTERALTRDGKLGSELIRCNNGQQALDFLLKEGMYAGRTSPNPSIVLLDLNMPGIDGRAVQ